MLITPTEVNGAYPHRMQLPALEHLHSPKMAAAIAAFIDTRDQVYAARDIATRHKAGHRIDDMTPEQIADAVRVGRETDRVDLAYAHVRETLNAELDAWHAATSAARKKAFTAARKAAAAMLAALDVAAREEVVLAMLEQAPASLTVRPGPAYSAIQATHNALGELLAALDAAEREPVDA